MLLETPECGEIRESTATKQELVLAQTLWRFSYRPIGKIRLGAVDGELKLAQATTHHLFVTCRVPVQRAQCEVELIGMNGAKTVQGSNHLDHDFWIGQLKTVDGTGKKAEREIEGRSQSNMTRRPTMVCFDGSENFIDRVRHEFGVRGNSFARGGQNEPLWLPVKKDESRDGPRDARCVAARWNGASPTHQPRRRATPRGRPRSTCANRPSRSRVAFLRAALPFLTIALQILGPKLRSGNR